MTLFEVQGLGPFSIETKEGVSVVRDADADPWLTCAAFPHEHAAALVALVHRERERSYGYGYRKGRADAEGEVQKLVSLVAKAWFQYHPQAGI
jgi:hypothetical protein